MRAGGVAEGGMKEGRRKAEGVAEGVAGERLEEWPEEGQRRAGGGPEEWPEFFYIPPAMAGGGSMCPTSYGDTL